MVNAAFPPNHTNSRAMETSLQILRGMADQGNAYLSSRHSLLLELRASIGPKDAHDIPEEVEKEKPNEAQMSPSRQVIHIGNEKAGSSLPIPGEDWQQVDGLPSLQDISFNFDPNDDSALWEGALNQIDIDMDTDWIESNLYR